MAIQTIERNDMFGRIGQNFGEGLSEQIPKEMAQQRLSQGLQKLEQQGGDLTNQQYFNRALQIPGLVDRPQVVESLGRLATKQQTRNNYGAQPPNSLQAQQNIQQMQNAVGATAQPQGYQPQQQQGQQARQGQGQAGIIAPQEPGAPQVNPLNPTRQEAIPRRMDTPPEFQQRVKRHLDLDQDATVDQARQRAFQDMETEMKAPVAEQEKNKYLEETQSKIAGKLKSVYEKKLQKQGTDVYADIAGDMLNDAERKVDREIAANPSKSIDDVVDRVSTELLDFAKAKKQLEVFANQPFSTKIGDQPGNYKKLVDYGKIYDKFGRNEEYMDYLTSNQDGKGANMTTENAASFAYPLTYDKNLEKYVSNIKPSTNKTREENSRRYALNIEPYLHSPKASILSIMQNIKEQDPFFDRDVFLDQLREDADDLELSPRLQREFGRVSQSATPNWGDFWIQKPGKKRTFTIKR